MSFFDGHNLPRHCICVHDYKSQRDQVNFLQLRGLIVIIMGSLYVVSLLSTISTHLVAEIILYLHGVALLLSFLGINRAES